MRTETESRVHTSAHKKTGIKITWVSSNTKAISLNTSYSNKDNVKMNVIHGEKDVDDVTLSLKLTKGAAFKTVKVATFKVEKN